MLYLQRMQELTNFTINCGLKHTSYPTVKIPHGCFHSNLFFIFTVVQWWKLNTQNIARANCWPNKNKVPPLGLVHAMRHIKLCLRGVHPYELRYGVGYISYTMAEGPNMEDLYPPKNSLKSSVWDLFKRVTRMLFENDGRPTCNTWRNKSRLKLTATSSRSLSSFTCPCEGNT